MDVVGSSDSQLNLEEQIDRISEFNRILNRILFSKDGSPQWKMGYYGSTGDGAVICFNLVRDPFRLSIRLLADISKRDKKLPDNRKFLSIH